jgi:hypothetical protein
MNGTLTMLAIGMASLGGVTPPEHIPPAPVPATAYQGLDCGDLMRAAETVDDDLARAWDRQEMLVRHRFGAPPPIVRRSEGQVAQLKGELEAIWRVADRKGCGEAPEQADLAWAPGREPGPMLGEPREREAFDPDALPPQADRGPEADAAYGEEPPADEAAYAADEPTFADRADPVEQATMDDDLAGGPGAEEPADVGAPLSEEPPEVDGYGEPQPRRDAGPARWPSADERGAPAVVRPGQKLDDVDWPKAQ